MAQHRNSLSVADAARLFEGLTRGLPQSAKELKNAYRVWMKAHHPDITGKQDPLSLEFVQWMNAAYDVLKAQDWTKTHPEPNQTGTTVDAAAGWTDVAGSSRTYADFDDESRRREEQLRRWREQQEKERREKEEEQRRRSETIKRRNEALKKRPLWQQILWGFGDSLRSDDAGLVYPGFRRCVWNLFFAMFCTACPIAVGTGLLLSIISAFLGPLQIGWSAVAAISIGGTLIIFISIALTYACIGAWKGLCWILSSLFRRKAHPKRIIPFVGRIIWKTPVVAVALLLGSLGASQAGWSGTELVVNSSLMEPLEEFVTGTTFAISAAMAVGPLVLVHKIAKPTLVLMVPILLYSAVVPGGWDGFASDFDATRVQAMRYHYANAYALEHMSPRGLFRTCQDEKIELTDDAKAVCGRALNVGPGERIPGSEHRCGALGMFRCFNTVPEK
jgi:hypothetical protein